MDDINVQKYLAAKDSTYDGSTFDAEKDKAGFRQFLDSNESSKRFYMYVMTDTQETSHLVGNHEMESTTDHSWIVNNIRNRRLNSIWKLVDVLLRNLEHPWGFGKPWSC